MRVMIVSELKFKISRKYTLFSKYTLTQKRLFQEYYKNEYFCLARDHVNLS